MSAIAADVQVRDLYARYKQLALAAGAALVLDVPLDELRDDIDGLLADARSACGSGAHRPQLDACVEAAGELHDLVCSGGDLEAVRRTHKRLRREVWKVIPCEYVPCCASPSSGRE